MNEQIGKKRDWIKNAAIVFLLIMLLLTFFSNTIMNYSLPEVSAQYMSSGTIQAKVRGSGTVQAGDPYIVSAESSRKVAGVAVRNGDHVEKGDVLYLLQEGDSAELKAAQKQLDQMLNAYKQSVLNANVDLEIANKILNGQFTGYNTYKTQIDALKNEIKALEEHILSYETEVEKVRVMMKEAENESGGTVATEKRLAYEASVSARKDAETALSNAVKAAGVTDAADAASKLTAISNEISVKQQTVNEINNSVEYQQAETMRAGYESKIQSAKSELERVTADGTGNEEVVVNEATGEKKTKQQLAQEAWNQTVADLNVHMASTVYKNLKDAEDALAIGLAKQPAYEQVVNANNTLNSAKKAEENAWKDYEAAGPDHSVAISQYANVIRINEEYILEQKGIVSEKEKAVTELLAQMQQENAFSAELEAIDEQRKLVAELKKDTGTGNIVAPISGTVQDMRLTAGNTTIVGEQVATILPDGTEFTMEVSVTREQAQRLSVGDIADIQNSWYYSDVTCVLQKIKTDKSDPAGKRILVFKVEGEVSDGQNLNISIGQRSANYDYIVPNSAIREDNNGKFILIVKQKSSPLGNRYYAERVDVQVLGSDDTKSAITGELNWDYVITTATKPVEAGQLIRLAD
jgi:hypothetical protein